MEINSLVTKEKQVVTDYFITHALTDDSGRVYGLTKDFYVSDWYAGNTPIVYYWSDVAIRHSEFSSYTFILRKGISLGSCSNQELSALLEQSKINLSK